jgi:serine/threonine-protein kinase PRP4
VTADGRGSPSASPTDGIFELAKDNEQEDAQAEAHAQAQRDGAHMISAADYDPSLDRREDEERRVRGAADQDIVMVEEEVEEEDDLDDMFAIGTTEKKKKKKIRQVAVGRTAWTLPSSRLTGS